MSIHNQPLKWFFVEELIVKTKNSSKENPEKVNDTIAYIEETFIGTEDVYVSIKSVFRDQKKVEKIQSVFSRNINKS